MKAVSEAKVFPRAWHLKSRLHLEPQLSTLRTYVVTSSPKPLPWHTQTHIPRMLASGLKKQPSTPPEKSFEAGGPHSPPWILMVPGLSIHLHTLTQIHTHIHLDTETHSHRYIHTHIHITHSCFLPKISQKDQIKRDSHLS